MLNWSKFDSDASIYSRGKNGYYVIVTRGIPEDRPKTCIIELYVTANEMTLSEITNKVGNGKVELLSRSVVLGSLLSDRGIVEAVKEMKDAAERRENQNPYSSMTSGFSTR